MIHAQDCAKGLSLNNKKLVCLNEVWNNSACIKKHIKIVWIYSLLLFIRQNSPLNQKLLINDSDPPSFFVKRFLKLCKYIFFVTLGGKKSRDWSKCQGEKGGPQPLW